MYKGYPQAVNRLWITLRLVCISELSTAGYKLSTCPLERTIRHLESTIVSRVPMVLIQDFHRLIGCYHFYPQAVDNYDRDCIA